MIYSSEELSPIRAMRDHCGTGACMNILNYFWGTTLNLKDTLDIETMIRFGHFDWNERPSEAEILYFLSQMGFKIEVFSRDIGDWGLYMTDPNKHQLKHGYIPHPLVDQERALTISKKLAHHPNYSLKEDSHVDIAQILKEHSNGKYMFLFGLDRNIIYNLKPIEGESGGHIMASIGYVEGNNDCIGLIETYPAAEIIERTYSEIYEAQRSFSPKYNGPTGEVTLISLIDR